MSKFVTTPHNYAGGKSRLLHRILPAFGDLSRHTFIDLFAGGLNVGLNVNAKQVIFNDTHADAVGIARYLSDSAPGQIELEVSTLVDEYELSDSQKHGYQHYGTDSSRGLAAANREQFLRLRQDINEGRFTGRDLRAAEFVLVLFSFNCYLQRSNATGRWTNPVGKRDFNGSVQERLRKTVDRLGALEHEIVSMDFELLDPQRYGLPFVYVDPPYALGRAPYNAGWSDADDKRLMAYLDGLTRRGTPWAMSNVLRLKGEQNVPLTEWAQGYQVQHLDFDYANSSHRRRDKSENDTDEVLILSV